MTGVIVGRFQVPKLHLGHIHLITEALLQCDRVFIWLGICPVKNKRNPYDFNTRRDMIQKLFPQIEVGAIADCSSDQEWSERLDNKISYLPDPHLFHSRDSFVSSYKGWYPTVEIPELKGYSGTQVRKSLKK